MRSCFVSLTHTTPTFPLPPLPPLHPSHKHWQASSPPTVASAWVNRARADVRACVMGGGSCGGGACRVVMAAVVGAGVKGVLKSLREGAVCTSKRAVSYVYIHLLYVYTHASQAACVCLQQGQPSFALMCCSCSRCAAHNALVHFPRFLPTACAQECTIVPHAECRAACFASNAWAMALAVADVIEGWCTRDDGSDCMVCGHSRCHMHDVPCVLCGV